MESIINVRAVCKICRGYPESTGNSNASGQYEHKCPSCGDLSYKEREYPYKRVVETKTYIFGENDNTEN